MALSQALIDAAPLRRSPQFRRLWVGRIFSGFGSQMTLVAVMFQVWQMTHSTVWTGAVGIAQATPIIAFGLFAGSIIDRSDRRIFYLVTTTGQAMCSVLLAVQGFFGHLPLVGVLLLVAAQSCFVAGGGPAARTFIPRLLSKAHLAAGLALNRIAMQGAMLLGPALGDWSWVGWASAVATSSTRSPSVWRSTARSGCRRCRRRARRPDRACAGCWTV
jgi:MFS family permease